METTEEDSAEEGKPRWRNQSTPLHKVRLMCGICRRWNGVAASLDGFKKGDWTNPWRRILNGCETSMFRGSWPLECWCSPQIGVAWSMLSPALRKTFMVDRKRDQFVVTVQIGFAHLETPLSCQR